ncbi:putative terpene synthase 2, partial [Mucuna pruriens]
MSAATLPLSSFNPDVKSGIHRHVADFHPSIWKDYFLQYASETTELDQSIETQIETLKREVRNMLVSKTDKPLAKVDLIDSICRLGVNYHFEHEIDQFKDVQGNFSERLASDVEGMLCLYEASHTRIHGEDILEEALVFTSTHLEAITTQLSPSLATEVNHSLRQALHKNLPRLEARRYISIYEKDPSHNEILLTFAKLDFNKLQNLHQKEFGYICKWWNELDVPSKLPY